MSTSENTERRIGIDIGRVLMAGPDADGEEDTTFLVGSEADAMATPPKAGAFDVVARLVTRYDGRVWLVSKCGEKVQARTRNWLEYHRFYDATGFARDHLRFCRKRPEKRDHAVELALTDFVDDRLDVLEHLRDAVRPHGLFLFGPQPAPPPPWVRPVADWNAVARALLD